MKRIFISILLFYLIVHFIIPGAYFLIDGNFSTYTRTQDNAGILKGFILNSVTILGAVAIIYFLPGKEKKLIEPKFYKLTGLYYFSILLSAINFFMGGGFEGRIGGSSLGSIFNYLAFFISPFALLLGVLFFQRKKFNVIILFLTYFIYITITGSRSGFISLFIIFLMYPAFKNYEVYKRSIKRLLGVLLIVSPLFFLFATILIRKSDLPLDPNFIARLIMGRMSFLETSMLPIHYKDMHDPLYIFYDKYGITNQIKQIIDALFPGNLFGSDVMPNQYYRAAFMGYSIDFVISVYTSINITLPVYLYMYLGGFFACFVGIAILIVYYKLMAKSINNIFLFVPLLASLYHFLYFFDLVMWFLQFFTFLLTTATIYAYSITRSAVVKSIKDANSPLTNQT